MSGEEDNYAYDDGSGDEAAGCRRHELELDIHDAGSAGARKAEHEDEKIKLSKRKRKKLEQIRKKKELQERQSAILDELQKHRLTAEESRRMGSTAVNLSAAGKRREAALAAKRQRELDKDEEIRGAKKAKLMQEQLEKQKQEAETEAAAAALAAAAARSAEQGDRNEKATEMAPLGASGIGPCGRGRKVKKKQVVEAKAASIQADRDAGVSFGAKPGQRGFLDVEVPKMSAEMDDADLERDDFAAAGEDEESEARSAAAGGAGEGAATSTFMSLDSLVAGGSNKAGKPSSETLLPRDDVDADAQAAPEANTAGQKASSALFKIHKPEPLPQSSKTVDVTPRGTISSYKVERRPEIQVQRNKLPAIQMEQEVVEAVLEHDVVLIAGDTGCGKSTQVPQFLYENGLSEYGTIAVTQPRRVAAISVAQRVADELNSEEVVGYQVRYDKSHNCSSGKTKLKFLTDGIVLREVQRDFLLSQYSVVVLDEAHERSVNCDILIGMLSRVVAERRKRFEQERQGRELSCSTATELDDFRSYKTLPLKLVIMSATLRVCDFTENERLFSSPPPVVRIDAKTFPVTIHFDRFTSQDYIKDAAKRSLEIHEKLPPGTILVFATGRMEVHRIVNQIKLLQRLEGKRKTAASRGDDDAEALDETEGGCDNSEAEEDFDDDITGAGVKEDHRADNQDSGTASTVPGAADVEVEKPRPLKPSTRKQAVRALKNQLKKAAKNSQGEVKKWAPKNADVLPAPNAAASVPDNRDTKSADAPAAKVEDEDEELLPADVFALDEHEDCAELKHGESPGEQEQADEDEYKKEKRIQMSKLDRSRTARGLFCGSDKYCETLTVLPLYAQLPARDQLKVFRKPAENERIVIVSTNVAETSVTLPNVRYVVDCGYEKKRNFTPSGISSFSVQFVSKASADQRAGRSGRVGPGHCYRLYSSAAYGDHFQQFPPINILNQPMDSVLLSMAAMGIPQLDRFPWPTPPPERNVRSARERLLGLGAFDVHDNAKNKAAVGGDVGIDAADLQNTTATSATSQVGITTMGRRLALLPMPPRYSVMLYQALQQALSWVKASREHCDQQKQKQDLLKNAAQLLECACLVAAALSTGNVLSWNAVGSAGVIGGAGADGAKDDERKGQNNQNGGDVDGDDATGDEVVNEEEEDANFSTSRKKQQAADARDAAILAEQEQYGVKRGGKDAKRARKQPDWLQCDDDMEALLWAMQNYAAMSGSDQLQREDFCKDNWIHPKNIEESNNLANQLQMILKTKLALPKALLKAGLDHTRSGRKNRDASSFKTANRNGQASFSQLDPQVSLSLRRCILCGLIDHVAKQSPERPKLYDAALPHSADKSYLKVQAGLHISSRLLHKRPALLAYVDLMSSVCARTGRKKHFLSGCVAVDPVDLGRLNVPVDFSKAHATATLSPSAQRSSCSTSNAQTKFATPLLSYADILAIPTPKYDKTTHQITVHVAPRYLPLEIRLPTLPNVNVAHVENSVAHANKAGRGGHSDAATSGAAAGHGQQLQTTGQQVPDALSVRYRVFAKALLDGHIFPQTVKFCAGGGGPGSNLVTDRLLTSRPNELLSTCNSAVANLVFELQRLRCSDKKSFVEGGLRLRDALLGCFPKNVRVAVVKELVESGAYKS